MLLSSMRCNASRSPYCFPDPLWIQLRLQHPAPPVLHLRMYACMQAMQHQLSSLVGVMRPGQELIPVVVVGGGAPLCGDTLPGASRVVRPLHADMANAVGAAIPQASEGLGRGQGQDWVTGMMLE